MVQYAVTKKSGEWTVFRDAEPILSGVTRSAAIEHAKSLAYDAEERGEDVEVLIQGYHGQLDRKVTGGE